MTFPKSEAPPGTAGGRRRKCVMRNTGAPIEDVFAKFWLKELTWPDKTPSQCEGSSDK